MGRWYLLTSENFEIHCEGDERPALHLARHAESLRRSLYDRWFGEKDPHSWNPRCQIVLHATREGYVSAAGPGSARTSGTSNVCVAGGRVESRRIDLLGGTTPYLSAALPHELTHILLRERFLSEELPRWADEGAAILADSPEKQRRHARDLYHAMRRGTAFRAAALVTLAEYPPDDLVGAFYGQSASLTRFLVDRESPQAFVEFLHVASRKGYDEAIRACYRLDGLAELERAWLAERYYY